MPITNFPPLHLADEYGLLAVGGDLEVASLLLAYKRGIFPWPINRDYPLAWFSPDPRGVLYVHKLHLSRSLKKLIRHCPYTFSYNQDFEGVIKSCQQVHKLRHQGETWITPEIVEGYINLHKAGHAYSVEVWNNNQELVGGLYGVTLGHFISGESMFYRAPNASKLALAHLLIDLKENEIPWIDTQMVTPVVASMGGEEIPRRNFVEELKAALNGEAISFLRPTVQSTL